MRENKHDAIKRIITIIPTKEGTNTFSVNNILIHSKYYPTKEAENFINENKHVYENKKIVIVYGLGFAYHIKILLSRVEENCNIYIFDCDSEVVKIAKQQPFVQEILNDKRVKLFCGYSKEVLKEFKNKLKTVQNYILYKPSMKVLPNSYESFKNALMDFEISKIALEMQGEDAKRNYELNLNMECKKIEEFFYENNFKDKPVIIISAGPSLDDNIHKLRLYKDKVILFAVGSALRPLMMQNIKPNIFCLLDADEIVYEQIKGYEDLDIPLCFLSTASHKAVSSYNGPKYMFYNEEHDNNLIIETGKSVATAVLDIAIKGNGNPLIFVGQDLAYVSDKTHCKMYVYGSEEKSNAEVYRKVEGVNGQLLNTSSGLLFYKRWIERRIAKEKNTLFINCSRGARITGTIEMQLEDAINKFIK